MTKAANRTTLALRGESILEDPPWPTTVKERCIVCGRSDAGCKPPVKLDADSVFDITVYQCTSVPKDDVFVFAGELS